MFGQPEMYQANNCVEVRSGNFSWHLLLPHACKPRGLGFDVPVNDVRGEEERIVEVMSSARMV